MIDFLKIGIYSPSLIQELRQNPLLDYCENKEWVSWDQETIKCKDVFTYKKILFCFYSNKAEILFKPHYYYNNNLHNANDFSYKNCIDVLKDFIRTFQFTDLLQLKIINIEFGVNIISPVDCKDLVTFLCYHSRNEFRTDTNYQYSKKSYRVNHKGILNKYKIVKAYNKGIQYPQYCDINTFRFEVKSKEYKYIKHKEITSIQDLLCTETYKTLAKELIADFKEVLLIEDNHTNYANLNPKQSEQLKRYQNPLYWYRIVQSKKDKNGFKRNKENYGKLLDVTGCNLHKELLFLIQKKLQQLVHENTKQGDNSTVEKKGQFHTYIVGNVPYLNAYNSGKEAPIKISKKESEKKSKKEDKKCLVTNLDISMQKGSSFLLSHTGLQYYYTHNKKLFDQVKRKYLSHKWFTSDLHTQIKEIAHNIRNRHNFTSRQQKRLYTNEQINFLELFSAEVPPTKETYQQAPY